MNINIDSQIVVQTAAQWAADNTVYSAKRILVTSDAYYGTTDQRKFKIADGVQTWSNLDYLPIGLQTLAEVLANGNSVNGTAITSQNGINAMMLDNTYINATYGANFSGWYFDGAEGTIYWSNGTKDGQLNINALRSELHHDDLINLNAPTINLPQGTASKFLKTDANKNITYVDSPVDVNTIGSAINGANSATPNDTDLVMSVDSSVAKKNTWTQVKAFLKTYFDTVYKATFTENTAFNKNFGTTAGTVLEGNRITQTITNGVTDKAPSEDAVYDALALKSSVIAKQTIDTSVQGTTTPTIVTNIAIPANSMGANDIGFIEASFYKTGTTDNATWTLYISPTSNSIVGATPLGNSVNTAAQALSSMHRTVVNKNSQSTNFAYLQSGGVENPWVNASAARVSMNQDFSTILYLIVTVTMGGTTDTGGVDWIYMTKQ